MTEIKESVSKKQTSTYSISETAKIQLSQLAEIQKRSMSSQIEYLIEKEFKLYYNQIVSGDNF